MIYDNYRFQVPREKLVRVITDTDAKNEADDQFAIVQTILSPKCDNVGFVAAHFGNERTDRSMEQSYHELEVIFQKMKLPSQGLLFHGAPRALADMHTPVDSEGARLIVREAMAQDDRPLFVTFMGPLTDLASAFLLEPKIAGRFTAIWIGGGAYPGGGPEFNLKNDIHAANVVLSSGIDLWQVPKNVYEMMPVSLAELEERVYPYGEIGRYLLEQLVAHSFQEAPRKSAFRTGEVWVLGDNPSIGLILYEHRFLYDSVPAPEIAQDMTYRHSPSNEKRPLIRVYRSIDSRLILEDMYCKIKLFAQK